MVVIASPSALIRKRWQQAVRGCGPIHEVANQIGLREAFRQYERAVLLLDSDLVQRYSTRHLLALLRLNLSTRTIFLTDHVQDNEAISVLKAGATGYSTKKIAGRSLRNAVAAVKRGELWVNRRLISLFIENLVESRRSRNEAFMKNYKSASFAEGLSPREFDIACMIGIGEQNKLISSHLNISESTVKAHLTNIFKKLGLSSRTQLALFVRQHSSMSDSTARMPTPFSYLTLTSNHENEQV
jgi:DNA-binding NarL/FixJ family response regulator